MSHTTEVSNIVFTDITALQAAVNELCQKGIKCSLVKDAIPRAYYANQQGMEKAAYVLKLDDSAYDVGFYWDKEKKGYVARTDLFLGRVACVIGAKAGAGESQEQAAMGRLYQTYAIHAATRKAVSQGMSVKRINNDDGSVRLVVNGYK